KSAFAAHLWLDQHIAHVCHFCIGGRDSTLLPANFVASLREQLDRLLPGYPEAVRQCAASTAPAGTIHGEVHTGSAQDSDIAGVRIGTLYLGSIPPDQAFDLYIRRPLRRLEKQGQLRPLVILVDALDEAISKSEPTILSLLCGANDLPTEVRFVLTTRPLSPILDALCGLPYVTISAGDQRNQEDVRRFLAQQWDQEEELRRQVGRWGADWDRTRFIEHLA
ncbi:MAG: hypothetical protein H5U01_12160, partial [Clostridia bacterium]|nr:hypothetical protein [Clostridia bacterium]